MSEQNKESVTISLTRYNDFQNKVKQADRLEANKLDLEKQILYLFHVLNESFKKDFNRMDRVEDFLQERNIRFSYDLDRLYFIN